MYAVKVDNKLIFMDDNSMLESIIESIEGDILFQPQLNISQNGAVFMSDLTEDIESAGMYLDEKE